MKPNRSRASRVDKKAGEERFESLMPITNLALTGQEIECSPGSVPFNSHIPTWDQRKLCLW